MKSFVIDKNDANKRLDKFIAKAVPGLPSSLMYKYIRTKRIKICGRRAEISTRLSVGDVVDMYINDEFFKPTVPKYDFLSASPKIDIVYEDENILLVNKKQGLLVHPDKNEYGDTLISRIQHYLYNKGEYDPDREHSFRPALANRIDRNTCGIVIAAKTAEALQTLCEKIKEHEIEKWYLAIIHGCPNKKSDTLTAYLEKDADKNRVFLKATPSPNSKMIKTAYQVLAVKNNLSLVKIRLLTGRTHQIRAQFSFLGHPLLGDGKYGNIQKDKKQGFKHQALCSYKLKFNFTTPAGCLEYLNQKAFQIRHIWFIDELFDDINY